MRQCACMRRRRSERRAGAGEGAAAQDAGRRREVPIPGLCAPRARPHTGHSPPAHGVPELRMTGWKGWR